MSSSVDVDRGPDRAHFARVPLARLLERSVLGALGLAADDAATTLFLHRVPDDETPPTAPPAVHNRQPHYGYATVEVRVAGRVVYRHPHTTAELVAAPLRQLLAAADPAEVEWGYSFAGLAARDEVTIPTPEVRGAVPVTPFAGGEQPGFQIRRLPDPVPPPARLADFGVGAAADPAAPVKVLLGSGLFQHLAYRGFSADVEEGGFLLGRVYQDADAPGTYLVRLTAAPAARHTGASLLHFTFTGDSFEDVKRGLRGGTTDERMAGWYHTHLFAASDGMGLSSIDVRLHFTTFLLPWQLAGLVNIEDGGRVLRFYTRRQDAMVLCPHWVTDVGP